MTGMPPVLICCVLASASTSAVRGCPEEPCRTVVERQLGACQEVGPHGEIQGTT